MIMVSVINIMGDEEKCEVCNMNFIIKSYEYSLCFGI